MQAAVLEDFRGLLAVDDAELDVEQQLHQARLADDGFANKAQERDPQTNAAFLRAMVK